MVLLEVSPLLSLAVEVPDILESVQVAQAHSQDEEGQSHHVVPWSNAREENYIPSVIEFYVVQRKEMFACQGSCKRTARRYPMTRKKGFRMGASGETSGTGWGVYNGKLPTNYGNGVDLAGRARDLSRQLSKVPNGLYDQFQNRCDKLIL